MSTFTFPVQLKWSGSTGSPGVNVFHGRTTVDLGTFGSEMDDLSDILKDFYTSIAYVFPVDLTIKSPDYALGVGASAGLSEAPTPWTVTGTGSASYAPPASAILVNWRAATGGRRGKGRTFLGPHVQGMIDSSGGVSAPDLPTLNTAVSDFIDASDTFANGAWGIYSRTGSLFRDFVSGSIPPKLAVLTSRRD